MFSKSVLLLTLYIADPVLFSDDFNNEDLPGWDVRKLHGIDEGSVEVRDGKLILANDAHLHIETRQSRKWFDYTATLQLRFLEVEAAAQLTIDVRTSLGRFNVWTSQHFNIFPKDGRVTIHTMRPERHALEPAIDRGTVRQTFKVGRWYRLAIEILDNNFAILLDNRELLSFKDRGTLPGTVCLGTGFARTLPDGQSLGKIRVEIDSIRVAKETVERLSVKQQKRVTTTTWAELKHAAIRLQ